MAGKALNGVFQRIRALAAVHTDRASSDGELLDRFCAPRMRPPSPSSSSATGRWSWAFAGGCCATGTRPTTPARRPSWCWRARPARCASRSRWQAGCTASPIASRSACGGSRPGALKREAVQRQVAVAKASSHEADGDLSWRELREVLDEELERLPERYRTPLILCYLEGKTRDEAAQQLGAKPGALHGLLDRGRKLLRQRLSRRGLELSAVLFATILMETAARAALAPAFVVASARAALALVRGEALGQGLIGPQVLSLVKEASKAMFMTKLKIGAALVTAAAILTGVVGGSLDSVSLAQDAPAAQPKATQTKPAAKTESDEEFIRRISKDLRGVDPSPTEIHFFVVEQGCQSPPEADRPVHSGASGQGSGGQEEGRAALRSLHAHPTRGGMAGTAFCLQPGDPDAGATLGYRPGRAGRRAEHGRQGQEGSGVHHAKTPGPSSGIRENLFAERRRA